MVALAIPCCNGNGPFICTNTASKGAIILDLFSLEGKTALVTGSSRGIGFALAGALAGAGARVILNGRDPQALEKAREGLRRQGAEADICVFDVTDPDSVYSAIASLHERGPIDILVNNAGIQRRAPLHEFDDGDWRELMATNVDGIYYVSKAVAKGMIARGRGKIINIASVQSELARPSIAPYTAAKGAVRNLTRGMCADWAPLGLQINAIAPGYFDTPLNAALVADEAFDSWLKARTPARRWGEMSDLHGAVIFLASQASDFINGQTIYIDGGITTAI